MKRQRIVKMPLRRTPVGGGGYVSRRTDAYSRVKGRSDILEDDKGFEVEDYEVEAEPNMKFSHALFVVLALHVIAVGGIIAFNSIKSSQTAAGQSKLATSVEGAGALAKGQREDALSKSHPSKKKVGSEVGASSREWPKYHTVVAGDTLTRVAATYGTSIEAIERANGLTLQSRLKIGQVLEVPEPGVVPVAAVAGEAVNLSGGSPALRGDSSVATPNRLNNKQPVTRGEAGAGGGSGVAAKPAPLQSKPIQSVPILPSAGGSLDSGVREAFLATRLPVKESSSGELLGGPSQPAQGNVVGKIPAKYTVVKGDNPYSIAKKYGVSYKKLLEINGITDPTKIQIGQVLKMPRVGE